MKHVEMKAFSLGEILATEIREVQGLGEEFWSCFCQEHSWAT